jgi:Lsr2
MAQKVIVTLEDDLDGGQAAETVRFRYEGADYEIDLSAANARAFRKELAPFIKRARTPERRPASRPARTAAGRRRSAEIRAWAKEHGIAVSARGRIPLNVLEQYEAATKPRLAVKGRRSRLVLRRAKRITSGCPQGTIIGYRASPGWDPVAGWGSPDAQVLIPSSPATPADHLARST